MLARRRSGGSSMTRCSSLNTTSSRTRSSAPCGPGEILACSRSRICGPTISSSGRVTELTRPGPALAAATD